MSVTAEKAPEVWWIGKPAELGGPHGYFGGRVNKSGAAGGGTNIITFELHLPAEQGYWVIIRSLIVSTSGTTTRPIDVKLLNSYWGATYNIATGTTVVGEEITVLPVINSGNPTLWRPAQNVSNAGLLSVLSEEINGENLAATIVGEIWLDSRLRQQGTGPLIRW